jgi:tetratricopeptide (TPR) repeat protein
MSKKKRKRSKKPSQTPGLPSQRLHAIDRSLERERFDQALQQIDSALEAFPQHGGLLRRRIQALLEQKRDVEAEMTAYKWTVARPRNIEAWLSLYTLSLKHGRQALAIEASLRFNELADQAGESPLSTLTQEELEGGIFSPFTGKSVNPHEFRQMDLGQLCIESRHFEEGIEFLHNCSEPPARNNLGICLFQAGRFDEALQCFNESWHSESKNLIALSGMARLLLFLGEEDRALGLSAPLSNTLAVRPEDAIGQLTGLVILGKETEALEVFNAARELPWWDNNSENVHSFALLNHMGAVCCARTGDTARAKMLWHEALSQNSNLLLAKENLADLNNAPKERNGAWLLPFYEYLPSRWLDRIRRGGPGNDATTVLEPISNIYFEAICRIGDEFTLNFCSMQLINRVEQSDPEAEQSLLTLLEGRQGSHGDRFNLGSRLLDAGIIDRNDQINLWDGEQSHKVLLKGQMISGEARPSSLTPVQQAIMGEAIEAFKDDDLPKAKQILERLTSEAPKEPSIWSNLAAIYEKEKNPQKAEELLTRAIEINPDYLMGRCNLAMCHIKRGDNDAAKNLLDGLMDYAELHIQEAITLYGAHAMLHARAGELEQARQLLDSMEAAAEEYGETERLDSYRGIVDEISGKGLRLIDRFSRLLK